jgi:hypothetical protein
MGVSNTSVLMQVNGRVAMLAIVALTALEEVVGVPFF